MITRPSPPPRVAIIRNYSTTEQWGKDMLNGICDLVHASAPTAEIQHYSPLEGGCLPEATSFDLVILTGGLYDLTSSIVEPWVSQTLEWVRDTYNHHSHTKILGICWGHQAVLHAMGGTIDLRKGGILIDVEELPLTASGREFFQGSQNLRLHKFHKRVVSTLPEGFKLLADNEEIVISENGQVLSFQGHPEMAASIAQQLVDTGDSSYLSDPSPTGIAKLHNALEEPHDGVKAFGRAMSWAFSRDG
ncbi:hypothetical protein LTR84_013161 [Exophiala bonariae]|uniref:Glutamine amidotransferase domain-containing protein n=1 Tax=Exophiala bonariae TaxID=1690606 RepID=A0AAV9NHJ4_9EURO|nr:hypothetical protein LTR84_013161 [Exophiala bonariae]